MGNGETLTSAYTASLFLLTAIMYIDDTDLIHWAPIQDASSEELVLQVQTATMDWA